MSINKTSIKKPVSVLMLTLLVAVLGLFFLRNLSVDLLPRITYPMIRIMIDWKGASPLEIEENITKKVERSVATTEDAVKVVSKSMEGISSIEVYFDFGKNMDVALADTTAKLLQVRKELPADIIEPKIYKADPSQLPIMEIALYSKTRSEKWLRWWAENDLGTMFLGIEGLGAVVAGGGKVREIQVIFNNVLLQRYELSTAKLLSRLKQENLDTPAGRITSGKKEYSVRLLSKFKTVNDIENIILKNFEGRITRLKDVASVVDVSEEQRVITRFNGAPSVMLSFIKQPNANTVEIAQKIMKRAAELKKRKIIPEDVNFSIASTQAYYINSSIENVSSSAMIGGFLAMIVIFFFLHSIKRTFIIAVAIPVSILATFILMGLGNVTLNIFSLGGLVLAVGMLVDNSVVMLENIARYQHQGLKSIAASEKGSSEILSALIASTLTSVTAMIPFFFIKGISALLFRDMVITIIAALSASLLVSFTLVPSISARFFKKNNSGEEKERFIMSAVLKGYQWLLKKVLKRKIVIPVILIILIIPGIILFKNLGSIFLPKIDDGRIDIKIKMPTGTALAKTDSVTKEIEKLITKVKGVKTTYSMIGGYWQSKNIFESANEASITIQLIDKKKRPWSTQKTILFLRDNLKKIKKTVLKDAIVKVIPSKLRGIKKTSDSDIEIRLLGPDLDVLYAKAQEIKKIISPVPGLVNPDLSIDISRPEIHVQLDKNKLSNFGLTASDVSAVLRTSIYGMVDTYFSDKQLNMDFSIRLIRNPAEIQTIYAVKNIQLYPPSGVDLRLYEVAKVSIGKGPVQVDRENQVRILSVTADAGKEDPGRVFNTIREKLKNVSLDPGYRLEFGGEYEALKESSGNLMVVILLGIFMVYVVMTVQYESLLDPLIILFTVPLAVIGAIVFLAMTSTPFSTMVLLGIILLVGIVVNNAIIMIEFINERKKDSSHTLDEVIMEAALIRLRPILMTSVTTVIGMVPLALGWGEGLEMLQPLAITMAGGLSVSTLLTLFVIPVFYSAIYTVLRKKMV